ncbi:unnamed protein product, partial [Allacma fusca]
MGDEYPLSAKMIGTINVEFRVGSEVVPCTVKNVLLVEEVPYNLLSSGKLDDAGYFCLTGQGKVEITDENGEMVAIGRKSGKLYEIECDYFSDLDSCVNVASVEKDRKFWHRALGHVNFFDLRTLCREQAGDGLPDEIPSDYVNCDICDRNKLKKLPFKKNCRFRARQVMEIVHTDVSGPHSTLGYLGQRYFVTFIDDFSKYVAVYTIKSKDEVLQCFQHYYNAMCTLTGKKIKYLRCDNGREYINKHFYYFAKEKGFKIQKVPPYTQALNGVAERYNQIIMNRSMCLFDESNLDRKYWPEVVKTSVYLGNRIMANSQLSVTPYEIIHGRRPDLSNVVLYGSSCFVRVPDQKRVDKFSKKGVQGTVVGYGDTGYRVLIAGEIVISRHVKIIDSSKSRIVYLDTDDEEEESVPKLSVSGEKTPKKRSESENSELRRSQREKRKPDWYGEPVAYFIEVGAPQTYSQAVGDENSEKWQEAMERELENIEKNETWSLVDLPEGKKALGVKWVYSRKWNGKYKARLVVLGYQQEENGEESVYSPVASMTAVKSVLVLAQINGWEIEQLDVDSAFLNGTVKSEVYVEQPKGFKKREGKKVYRLWKALYGLRESPRCWFQHLDEYLKSLGFRNFETEKCVYILVKDGKVVFLVIFVDDFLVTGDSDEFIEYVKSKLCAKFSMKVMGKVKNYLGIEITRDSNSMKLSQRAYIEELAEKYRVNGSLFGRFNTPMETGLKLVAQQGAVTRASTHAEYYALADAVQEVVWVKWLISEFGLGDRIGKIKVYEDNLGARQLGNNGNFTGKSKHIDIAKRFVVDYVEKKEIVISEVASIDNIADTFTKPLDKNKFVKFRSDLGSNDRSPVPLFDGIGYSAWRFRLELFLEEKELQKWLTEAPTSADDKKADLKARNFIVRFLSDNLLELISNESTAFGMITRLDEVYQQQNDALQILAVHELNMLQFCPEKETPNDFVAKFNTAVNKIRDAGKPMDEKSKLHSFILKLPDSMGHISDIVDVLPEGKSKLSYVQSKFITHGAKLLTNEPKEKSSTPVSSISAAKSEVEERVEGAEVFKAQRGRSHQSNHSSQS